MDQSTVVARFKNGKMILAFDPPLDTRKQKLAVYLTDDESLEVFKMNIGDFGTTASFELFPMELGIIVDGRSALRPYCETGGPELLPEGLRPPTPIFRK